MLTESGGHEERRAGGLAQAASILTSGAGGGARDLWDTLPVVAAEWAGERGGVTSAAWSAACAAAWA